MSERRRTLRGYAWLSIATAIATIGLKASAYYLTGSVGLLSDALESIVNLVAAVLVLITLTIATLPPDEEHAYGHAKAEYFSCGAEGTLILIAAMSIVVSAVRRLMDPRPLEQLGIGLAISVVAALMNLVVARILSRAGDDYESITLKADSQHLMTDVWTSGGVLVGVGAVGLTGWVWLDPVIAILVAMQIIYSGFVLVRKAVHGLMDASLPVEEVAKVVEILESYTQPEGIEYHALRSRQSGSLRFVSFHIQVPGGWTVQHGHTFLEEIEDAIRQQLPSVSVFTHLEPVEDPVSWHDVELRWE